MTKPTDTPFEAKTQKMVVLTLGWRKILIPHNPHAVEAAAAFINMIDGQSYDECFADAQYHHLTGGKSRYLVPDSRMSLSIEEVLIANRNLTADDAMPAAAEDADRLEPLAVAAE